MPDSGLSDATVIALAQGALMTTLMIAAPILITSLVIGMTISVFQAMTQINEVTLTFVPKIFGVFAVAAILGPWMVGTMVDYTTRLFEQLPRIAQ
jgi:flagellar biosynthesis protein FliQ